MNERHPLKTTGTAEDISSAIEFLLSKNAEILTGQIITADYGYSIGK